MPHKSASRTQRVSRSGVGYGSCPHCDRMFKSNTAFRLHMKVQHPGEDPFLERETLNTCGSCKKVIPKFAKRCDKGCT